jgi:hypothetical protein
MQGNPKKHTPSPLKPPRRATSFGPRCETNFLHATSGNALGSNGLDLHGQPNGFCNRPELA